MEHINKLKEAIAAGKKLVWKDPEPIEDNDYLITYVEQLQDDWDDDTPILIQYGGGSEAEVFAHEIRAVLSVDEFVKLVGYDDLETLQDNEDVLDYPMSELAYVLEEVNDSVAFVEVDGVVRVFELPENITISENLTFTIMDGDGDND